MADVGAETERLLGNSGCSDGATGSCGSDATASAAVASSLLLPGSSAGSSAWILAPPPSAPFPDWFAAAVWGFAFSTTFSNGLGAATLGLCRSRRGAGGGAAGRCIQGPGWMMVFHGWLNLRPAPPELEVRRQRRKILSPANLTSNHPSIAQRF